MAKFVCKYCNHGCRTAKGLKQHQLNSQKCMRARENAAIAEETVARLESSSGESSGSESTSTPRPRSNIQNTASGRTRRHVAEPASLPTRKSRRLMQEEEEQHREDHIETGGGLSDHEDGSMVVAGNESEGSDDERAATPRSRHIKVGVVVPLHGDDEDEDSDGYEPDAAEVGATGEEEEESEENADEFAPSDVALKDFREYCDHSYQHFPPLSKPEAACIRIMYTLIKKKATLDTYEAVMEWHLRESGRLLPIQSLSDSPHYFSRYKMMRKLKKRYHMDKLYAKSVPRLLPHSKTNVMIYRRHARDLVVSILTDPRWTDDDWLFFDNDPFAPPPDNLNYIADVNTGEAYLKTYKKLITKPNQILVPLPTYIDGAVTGQFDKLQVTALKMSLGILTNQARHKEYAWQTLGLVPNYAKVDSRGKRMLYESGHLAAEDMFGHGVADDEEGNLTGAEGDVDKAADYHSILEGVLETLKELLQEGMVMDIRYRGHVYKNCELVFFMPFVKCDGDEGDKLCLSMRSRGKHIKQLCRYCQCPNDKTDDPQAKFPYKTEPMMKKLYLDENVEKLKELSQILAKNAFHGLRFGLHDDRGIHGACPWELLHAVLLGVDMYIRDCFFMQLGKTSVSAEEVNALSKLLGVLLTRQSERDKPRTKFGNGIAKGKLMAKEFTGVMLLMTAILRVQKGVDLLKGARKKNFREAWQRRDWILLVETVLQWEAYLNLPEMVKTDVHRLKKKNRFIMFLMKKIANRTKKMGFKLMKFHAIVHLAYDITAFGVPMVVDTGSNESHHKTTKVAAKLTQKDINTFEKQTSQRLDDFHTLELAMEELDNPSRPLWQYFDGYKHAEPATKDPVTKTCGMKWTIGQEPNENVPKMKILSRMKNKEKIKMGDDLLQTLWEIQQKVAHLIAIVEFFAEHHRNGFIFRSHPSYLGKGVWRDWVMVQWQVGNALVGYPAQIYAFADLSEMPEGQQVELDDGTVLTNNVYAIVESGELILEDEPLSDIWQPIDLEVEELAADGSVAKRKLYVVDVDTFKEPLCVIPNVGSSNPCEYLRMKPRRKWAEDFRAWLRAPHTIDEAEMKEPQPEQPDDEEASDEEDLEEEETEDKEDDEDSDTDDDQEASGDDDE